MNNFNLNEATALIRPSQKSFETPTNALLNLDYPFKENFLKYSSNPEEIKESYYIRFCFLLDFFSIELMDIINAIVLVDTTRDSKELFDSFKYKYNKLDCRNETLTPFINAFIENLKNIRYSKQHTVLNYSRERILYSYEHNKFVCNNHENFFTFLIEVIHFIENNVTPKYRFLHFLKTQGLLSPFTLRIWTDAFFESNIRNTYNNPSVLPNNISKCELLYFSTNIDFNNWGYILLNWEFYKKIVSDIFLHRNFITLLQMNIKNVESQIAMLQESEYTLHSSQFISDIENNSFLLLPLKQRRRNNNSNFILEQINKKSLQSQNDYLCFLLCNIHILSIVKLKSKHYLLLYYCACLNVVI